MSEKISPERLQEILESHRHWLAHSTLGERADLVEFNLSGLDLTGAVFQHALMSGVNLSGAKLCNADLRRADLTYANLRGANLDSANLNGAELSGADLSGANLRYVSLQNADLSETRLIGVDLNSVHGLPIPVVPNIDATILAKIEGEDKMGELNMYDWHCDTTHCRAGWAIHLAGAQGYALEACVGSSVAGALIYHKSAGYVPNFYDSTKSALADIKAHATPQSEAPDKDK